MEPDRIDSLADTRARALLVTRVALDTLPDLAGFVRDFAAWSETVGPDSGCDCALLDDLEAYGRKASDLVARLRGAGGVSP